ncbi:MAG: hypothetical protein IT374_27785 [Polyangiaceae bacterium]|nr:hypothetical protein [Polyangiaceae bacterium]
MQELDERRRGALAARAAEVGDEEKGAVLEAMFLMAAVDDDVSEVEIGELARACRPLLGDVSSGDVEGMLQAMHATLAEDGWGPRAKAVGAALAGGPAAELAFSLAARVALADDYVVGAESDARDALADALASGVDRRGELLREAYDELFGG